MNYLPRFAFTLVLWLGLLAAGQVGVRADDPPVPQDLTQILKVMPTGSGWSDVVAEATAENSGDGHPLYHSTQLETQSFEGDFTPDSDCLLAIFSDDGSDVTVDGSMVWSGKGTNQTLPKLGQSLHKLSVKLAANTTHHIRVDYSNTIYLGNGDIDGVTLFVYDRALDITFPSGLTNGTVRACAGAVLDSVHEQAVTIHATDAGNPAPNQTLIVSFDTTVDYTGCKAPQLLDDQNGGQQVSTLTRTTDGNGNISVTVLSSDLISQPNLIVSQKNSQLGSVGCDFGEAQTFRHYGIKMFNQGFASDTGWDFDSGQLQNEGDTTSATVYVKFQKDPSISIDQNYFLVDGITVPSLDINNDGVVDDDEYNNGVARGNATNSMQDANNWLPVSQHQLLIRVSEVDDNDGNAITDFSTIQQYVQYIDASGNPIVDPSTHKMPLFVSATTGADGSATIFLKAGSSIYYCQNIFLDVVDVTQIDEKDGITIDTGNGY